MPPRKKPAEPQQTDIEDAIAKAPPVIDPSLTADLLIKRELELDDYLSAQSKAFTEFCKPYRAEIEALRNRLLAMHLEQKTDQFKTEFGTSYISEIMQQKIDPAASEYVDADGVCYSGREALLWYMVDAWDKYGNEGLSVSVPIATIRQHMDDNEGKPPPGITVSFFKRVNIKKG